MDFNEAAIKEYDPFVKQHLTGEGNDYFTIWEFRFCIIIIE